MNELAALLPSQLIHRLYFEYSSQTEERNLKFCRGPTSNNILSIFQPQYRIIILHYQIHSPDVGFLLLSCSMHCGFHCSMQICRVVTRLDVHVSVHYTSGRGPMTRWTSALSAVRLANGQGVCRPSAPSIPCITLQFLSV